MPSALTIAEAFDAAQHKARGFGMPGMRLGMTYGNQARLLRELVEDDEREEVGRG